MYHKLKIRLLAFLNHFAPGAQFFLHRYKRGIKYSISGGSSALVALAIVYIATDIFKIWYLISVVFGQVGGFFVNFYLQKFWTFRDPSREHFERQFKFFIGLAAAHLMLNAVLIFVLVEFFGIWYLLSQALVMAALAFGSYLFNLFVTFKKARVV